MKTLTDVDAALNELDSDLVGDVAAQALFVSHMLKTGSESELMKFGFDKDQLRVVIERYRKTEDGSLLYDVTVEDPSVWVSPWVMPQRTLPLRPELEKVEEFVCEPTPDYSKFFGK